jgi:thioredoxin 2
MTTHSDGTVIRCPHCHKPNRVRTVAEGVPRCGNCQEPLPWVVSTDQGGFDAETTASVPVLVDFWAPWCGPCRLISPVLERLANRYAGRMKLVKVNVDDNPGLAARHDAMSIPLLVLFQHGREVDRQVGAAPESQLNGWIQPRLNTVVSEPQAQYRRPRSATEVRHRTPGPDQADRACTAG